MERHIEPKRFALVLTVFASNLLITGLVYGWAPLLLMLQDEGQYAELCDEEDLLINSSDSDKSGFACVTQENKLNLMFAVASAVLNAASLPAGIFVDYAGPTKAVAMAAVVEISGLILMAFADSQTFDVFLPAYSMLALGGSMTLMTSFPASFVVFEYQTAILAGINCLFDGSSVVFLVLYSMQSAFETTRQQVFIGLALVAGVIYLLLIVLWFLNESSLSSTNKSACEADKDPFNDVETQDETPNASYSAGVGNPAVVDAVLQKELDAMQLMDVPIRKQLVSTEFVFIIVFSTTQMLCATVYIGTTNKLLENYGDNDHDYLYTKIFSGILPLGFVFVPAINHIVEKKGLVPSLLVTNALGVAYNALSLAPNLPIQCLTFFFFTGFRSFLYAMLSVFVAKIFGLKNLGTLMGFNFFIGALVNMLEYPAVSISNEYLGGDLAVLYSITLFLCTALIPFTLYLRNYQHTKEDRMRQILLQ